LQAIQKILFLKNKIKQHGLYIDDGLRELCELRNVDAETLVADSFLRGNSAARKGQGGKKGKPCSTL